MIPGLPLAVLLATVLGFLCVSLLWPGRHTTWEDLLLRVCLGAGVGHGITSCLFFLWLLLHGRADRSYLAVEAVVLAILLGAFLLRGRARTAPAPAAPPPPPAPLRYGRLVTAAFLASLGVAVVLIVDSVLRLPHGTGWDAWSIYGIRARAIILGGNQWRDAFSGLLLWSHPDYPLLLPLSTARVWLYAGSEIRPAQAILTAVFALATVGVLYATLATLRSRTQGCLAGLVLMGFTTFVDYAASAYADVPLLFFFAATFALIALRQQPGLESHRWLVLAGLTVGLAAWTKNEGLLFVICFLVAHLVVNVSAARRGSYPRELLFLGLGLLPVLAIILYFKARLPPPNDLMAAFGRRTLANLRDPHRYLRIARAFRAQLTYYSGHGVSFANLLPIYLVCMGATLQHRKSMTQMGLTLCLMMAGCFFVYVTTPYDLGWHLDTSLDRVLMQQWPGFVLLYFLAALTPEEAFGAAVH